MTAQATPEQLGEELLRAAELVHKYAQTQDADRLLQYAGKCEGYYCQYFDSMSASSTSRGLCVA